MIDLDVDVQEAEHAATLKRLRRVEAGLKGDVVRRGLDVAAMPIVEAMKTLAPSDSGLLRKSIGRSKLSRSAAARLGFRNTKPGEQAVLIGPNRTIGGRNRGRVAQMLEEGTKAHKIATGGLLNIGKKLFVRRVRHPGIRATHFMSRALEQSESGLEARFFAGMKEKLDKLMTS